jgi:hypothetical protein
MVAKGAIGEDFARGNGSFEDKFGVCGNFEIDGFTFS